MRATRRAVAAVLGAVLIAALLALTNTTTATAADSGTESQFVAAINSIRAAHGLAPLAVYGELHSVARGWSDQMAAAGGISHNPSLAGEVSAPWRKLGENVGDGGDVSALMKAFVNSPAHYRNIVDPDFNYIGVGVSYSANGVMFTTHDFMALDDGSSSTPDVVSEPAPDSSAATPDTASVPTPSKKAAAAPASEPAPQADAAPADPPPPPPPPALPARVHTVLTALRVVGT